MRFKDGVPYVNCELCGYSSPLSSLQDHKVADGTRQVSFDGRRRTATGGRFGDRYQHREITVPRTRTVLACARCRATR